MKKQVTILIIPNGECWHYLAVKKKKLSVLLRGITPKRQGNFLCLNCFYSFETDNKGKSHIKVCENKRFCSIF